MKSKQVQEFKETEIGRIPVDWDMAELKDHLIIKGRIGWKGLKTSEYTDSGPFIVGGLQIIENKVAWEECAHVTDERYNESPEIMLHESDILMTKDGTIGKLAFIENITHKATVASHIHVIRKNSDKVLPLFLFYFFKSTRFQNLIQSKITGSVVPALTQRDINNTTFPIPSIHEQKSISEFLYSLYKKIENLQTQNKILEQTAQAIFKSWFVDFDGVTEFEDSELGKIPKGWQVVNLEDLTLLRNGKSLQRENLLENGSFPVYGSNGTIGYTEKCLNDSHVIVIGRVGANCGSIYRIDEKSWTTDNSIVIEPTDLNNFDYVYYSLNQMNLRKAIRGSAQPLIAQSELRKMKILEPIKVKLNSFSNITSPISKDIFKNRKSISILTKTRDALLPKLMSGEIRV